MANRIEPAVSGGSAIRDLDAAFTLSGTDAVFVSYTIRLSVTAPLLSTQSIQVDLVYQFGGGDPVTIDTIRLSSSQGGGLSLLSLSTAVDQKVAAVVPGGSTLQLVSSGAGSATMLYGQEDTLPVLTA